MITEICINTLALKSWKKDETQKGNAINANENEYKNNVTINRLNIVSNPSKRLRSFTTA